MSHNSNIRRLDLHDLDHHYVELLNEFAPVFTTIEEMKRCYLDRSFAGSCPTFLYLSDCGKPLGSITVQLVDKMIYRLPYAFIDDFIVADFKTNKKYRFSNDFNEYFLAPVDHLPYCEFNTYALQLSMYAYMYEQKSGKKCNKIVTLYLEEDTWIPYHANYLKSDIINILTNYKLNAKKVDQKTN